MQTTLSASRTSSVNVSKGATGRATTISRGERRLSARIATFIVAPVAAPSSTRITVLFIADSD